MKKKQVLLAVFAATMLTPTVVRAQYPQITGEAKENYTKMMTEERKRSDEAWAKALPIVHVIFVQPEFDKRNAETIAQQTGTKVIPINPLSYDWEEEMLNVAKALAPQAATK